MGMAAIVTGATGGIGYACVKELLKRGFHVLAMGTREVFQAPEGVIYVRGTVTNALDRQKVLDTAIAQFGNVKVLVNIAGIAPLVRMDLMEMTEESYGYQYKRNDVHDAACSKASD